MSSETPNTPSSSWGRAWSSGSPLLVLTAAVSVGVFLGNTLRDREWHRHQTRAADGMASFQYEGAVRQMGRIAAAEIPEDVKQMQRRTTFMSAMEVVHHANRALGTSVDVDSKMSGLYASPALTEEWHGAKIAYAKMDGLYVNGVLQGDWREV